MLGRLPPMGIGIDICRISRVYKNLTNPMGPKLVRRILSPEEQTVPYTLNILKCVFTPPQNLQSQDSKDPKDPRMRKAAEFLAGRFAAKEAAIKAYSLRKLSYHDIIVTYQDHLSSPSADETISNSSQTEQESTLEDQPKEKTSAGPPIAIFKGDGFSDNVYARLSISHDGDYATAMCLTMLENPGVPNES
ncbi:hypothetical protein F4818DRAFT_55752 [Hypoxylon cercidicola]|nr:hypothetical protein F4818DRAFT_55752 [Hypoxylon cercidicola]